MWRTVRRYFTLAFLAVAEWCRALVGRRPPYGVLTVELAGELSEEGGEQRLFGLLRRPAADYLGLISLLRWARDDAPLAAILVRCDDVQASWARLQELRRSLARLRAAGKKVWVHLERAGVREYFLASVADHVSLTPAATLDVTGLSSEAVFLLDALDKLGVEADVVQKGRYKSAGETFTARGMSPAQREMLEALVDDLYDQIAAAVAESRGMDPDAARDRLGAGPFTAAEAVAAKLIDAADYADAVEQRLVDACGGAATVTHTDYAKRRGRDMLRRVLRRASARLAVLHIGGTIKPGESIPGPGGASAAGAASIAAALKQIRERDDIGAVVVRVTSPGGSVLGSDLIWRELMRMRDQKPVIVTCGDVAASGGYYVAMVGTPLLAEGGTITGSIGVLAGKANLRRLYDRIGVSKERISRGRHAGIYSDYEPLDADGRARLQAQADACYRDFLAKVGQARRLDDARVAEAAEGRVWSGRQAHRLGLVDALGGYDEALDAAKLAIGVAADTPVAIERYPKPRRLWKLSLDLNLPTQGLLSELMPLAPSLRFILRERLWAVLPFQLRFF